MKENKKMNIVQGSAQGSVPPLPAELIAKFCAVVGDKYAVTDAADIAPYVTEERDLFHGRSPLVLRPASTAEVSAICKLASEHRIALVPQGGNTGLVGGQTPHNGEVVVSTRRMDKIRDIDTASNTMTCEAGVLLQIAQNEAAGTLTSFELLSDIAVDFSVRHGIDIRDPLSSKHPWYVLMELSSPRYDARATLESILAKGLDDGIVDDAVIAANL